MAEARLRPSIPPRPSSIDEIIVGDPAEVTRLDLAGRWLETLPDDIDRLVNLELLGVYHNRLTTLPEGLARLGRLQFLAINANPLEALPAALILPRLAYVLADTATPGLEAFLARHHGIIHMHLYGPAPTDLLERLPDHCPNLRSLNLIAPGRDLPAALGRLPDGVDLDIGGSITFPEPLASLAGDSGALRSYLRSRQRGEVKSFEAKLILVGEGKVGKSTLAHALLDKPFVADRATTHGIERHALHLPHRVAGGGAITLNIWDFGGQDVYRITHQFFYSSQAVTLLLWHPRRGVEDCQVEDWLRRLRARLGKTARVIVVATHSHEGRCHDIDRAALEAEFGAMLVDCVAVNSEDGDGIARLKALIADTAAGLPQMGGIWPRDWVKVRDALAARREAEPFIGWDEYQTLCAKVGINDQRQREVLAWLLHELGHIIHFADEATLKDTMVLDAEWASKAVSRVLEDVTTITAGGVLDHRRLAEIWGRPGPDGPGFDHVHHPFFLRLMERFDASYRIVHPTTGETNHSLVAQMLPTARPSTLPWTAADALPEGMRQLRLECRLRDEAPGLMPWLVVRTHRYSNRLHWRGGAHLHYPEHQSEALVEVLPQNRLSLCVRAPHPDHFFALLHDGIETLLRERWPGLKPVFAIPCPQVADDGGACPGWFDIATARLARSREIRTIQCHSCLEGQDVSLLLTGFAAPGDPMDVRLDRIEGKMDGLTERARELRLLLRGLTSDVRDCPPLFTLLPRDRAAWNPKRMVDQAYILTLWCTHPGHEHPVAGASYTVTLAKEWFATAAPYLSVTLKALRLLVPLGDAAILTQLDSPAIKADLNLMDKFAAALPADVATGERSLDGGDSPLRAENALLRWLAATLADSDTKRRFGGLRRVQDKASGDIHWVCDEHARAYDPGPVELPPPA